MADLMLPDRAVQLAAAAAGDVGLSPAGATVHRHVASVHVELPAAGAMARVEAAHRRPIARRQVQVAQFLRSRGVRVARLVAPERQPLVYADGIVTLWESVTILDRQPGPAALGRLARRLHDACGGEIPAAVPDLDLFPTIRRRLDRPDPGAPPAGIARLAGELERIAECWHATIADDPLGTVLVHGDFHQDNVVATPDGLTLLDLEEAGRGPATWDLVPHLVGVRRYGAPAAACRRFCEAYGADPLTWEGTDLLCRLYELYMTSWAVAHRHTSAAMAAEADVRLTSFLGESEQRWTLL